MPRYRYHFLNKSDQTLAREEHDSANLRAALEYAEAALARAEHHSIEIWEGSQKWFTVRKPVPAVRPRA